MDTGKTDDTLAVIEAALCTTNLGTDTENPESSSPYRSTRPATSEVITALRSLEKSSKQCKPAYTYAQLLGSWQLFFISGTKKVRPSAGKKPVTQLGKGRFLPNWVTITLTYDPAAPQIVPESTPESTPESRPDIITDKGRQQKSNEQSSNGRDAIASPSSALGSITNAVTLGPVTLQLSGPTRFWPKTNSLGFDFTEIQMKLGHFTLYQGQLRGGKAKEKAFKAQSLKDQAFFTFFAIQPDYIAARGRGGGLALWHRHS